MTREKIVFSPVTRLSGLLSVEVSLERNKIVDARVSSTMFRGFEYIMKGRNITDSPYLTQRVCGICSLAHGAVASYLVDEVFDNTIDENAQYLRNIMLGADFLQNHIRHFYMFSLPDYVKMPDRPPFSRQNLTDVRFTKTQNDILVKHYFESIKASQESHQLLTLFGGKAPHQHSFVHGGVSSHITSYNVNQALSLIQNIKDFIETRLLPDTELISQKYSDYFNIGITPKKLLSFGLFRFGPKNKKILWPAGVIINNIIKLPNIELIKEDISHSWFVKLHQNNTEVIPDPYKPTAYSWVKSVDYAKKPFEVGPLVRMILLGYYSGGTSTMDRICARSLETYYIAELIEKWLFKLKPGPAPISQNKVPVKSKVTAVTDAMRGALLHSAQIEGETVKHYNIITPTVWNFSPKNAFGEPGPVERALIGTKIPQRDMLFTIIGRIIRSFDPCLACATHVLDVKGRKIAEIVL